MGGLGGLPPSEVFYLLVSLNLPMDLLFRGP